MTGTRTFSFILAAILTLTLQAASDIIIVDNHDLLPLPGASIFSADNSMIGVTDTLGRFTAPSHSSYPITVRYLGYETYTLPAPADSIKMVQTSLPLNEIVVTDHADGVRMICYAREQATQSSGDITKTDYIETMMEYVLPIRDKVKKFKSQTQPRILNRRSGTRISQTGRQDSIIHNDFDNTFSMALFAEMSGKELIEPESLQNVAAGTATTGKQQKMTVRKSPGGVIYSMDFLADKNGHRWSPNIFKLLGMTIDFTELNHISTYQPSDNGRHPIYDMSSWSMSVTANGRGKFIKKAFKSDHPVDMHFLIEIYPVSYQLITSEESQEIKKEKRQKSVSFQIPDNIPHWHAIDR